VAQWRYKEMSTSVCILMVELIKLADESDVGVSGKR
jgi:hypothetical protein